MAHALAWMRDRDFATKVPYAPDLAGFIASVLMWSSGGCSTLQPQVLAPGAMKA